VASAAQIKVAVLDTGVDWDHEDLAGRVLPGYNAITGTADTQANRVSDDNSLNGHGTHVAGSIAALGTNDDPQDEDADGEGIAGVAGMFPVSILPVKVLGAYETGTMLDVAEGIYWAVDNGAQVVNLSLGGRLPDYPRTLAEAVQYALANGVLVVAAAGNEGRGMDAFYPASLPGVVSVGATTESRLKASYSNSGALFMAPGDNMFSTLPEDQYGSMDGTSQAAGFVSGLAALYLSLYLPLYGEGWTGSVTAAVINVLKEGRSGSSPRIVQMSGTVWRDPVIPAPTVSFVFPPDENLEMSGTVTTTVHFTSVSRVTGFRFELRDGDWFDCLKEERDLQPGDIPESGAYSFTWDTTEYDNGSYSLYAYVYYMDGATEKSNFNFAWIDIWNDVKTGLTIQVMKPEPHPVTGDPVPASWAWVTVHEWIDRIEFDPYRPIFTGQVDMDGKVILLGSEVVPGNDLLVTARGSDPYFYYVKLVRPGGTVTLDGTDAWKVTLTGHGVAGGSGAEPLVGGKVYIDFLEDNLPSVAPSGDPVGIYSYYDDVPSVTLDESGSAEIYLTGGVYDMKLRDASRGYYLTTDNVEVGAETGTVDVGVKGNSYLSFSLSPAPATDSLTLSLREVAPFWSSYPLECGDPGNGTFVLSPGSWQAAIAAKYPGSPLTWYADGDLSDLSPGVHSELQFGPPLTASLGIPEDSYAPGVSEEIFFSIVLSDAHGFVTDGFSGGSVEGTLTVMEMDGDVIAEVTAYDNGAFWGIPWDLAPGQYKAQAVLEIGSPFSANGVDIVTDELVFYAQPVVWEGDDGVLVTVLDAAGAPVDEAAIGLLRSFDGKGYMYDGILEPGWKPWELDWWFTGSDGMTFVDYVEDPGFSYALLVMGAMPEIKD